MITRRDLLVAGITLFIAGAGVALAQLSSKPVMHSCVFNWDDLKPHKNAHGEARGVFDAPTATLAEFECHITTLNPGESPHAAHRHPSEEVTVMREGTLEVVQEGRTNVVTSGGIIFQGSNELHSVRNVGTNAATYYVFRFTPHDLEMKR